MFGQLILKVLRLMFDNKTLYLKCILILGIFGMFLYLNNFKGRLQSKVLLLDYYTIMRVTGGVRGCGGLSASSSFLVTTLDLTRARARFIISFCKLESGTILLFFFSFWKLGWTSFWVITSESFFLFLFCKTHSDIVPLLKEFLGIPFGLIT